MVRFTKKTSLNLRKIRVKVNGIFAPHTSRHGCTIVSEAGMFCKFAGMQIYNAVFPIHFRLFWTNFDEIAPLP